MRSEAGRIALKSGISIGGILAARKLWNDGHKGAAVAVSLLSIGIPTAAAIHNSRTQR
jgi:hypothetical protein